MSDLIASVIPARRRVLGGHEIRRLLPSRVRQMVGPFIFFDHIGPEHLPPGRAIDVPPHPHIHLATVTYLFEGELVHRDSLGSLQTIRPGDVNWMHAGRGIVHSERSSVGARQRDSRIHGVQLWVALPRDEEETEPTFEHHPGASLPTWDRDGVQGRLLVGEAYGHESPLRVRSKTLYVDLLMTADSSVHVPGEATEICAYVVEGGVSAGGRALNPSEVVVFRSGVDTVLTSEGPSRVLLLGGDPVRGERHIWWNFVSSSPERIDQARRDWRDGRFPVVPGDEDERTALPE